MKQLFSAEKDLSKSIRKINNQLLGRVKVKGRDRPYIYRIFFFIFIYLAALSLSCSNTIFFFLVDPCKLLVRTCGMQLAHQGRNLGLLHWERGVLATGPPGKSPTQYLDSSWVIHKKQTTTIITELPHERALRK